MLEWCKGCEPPWAYESSHFDFKGNLTRLSNINVFRETRADRPSHGPVVGGEGV